MRAHYAVAFSHSQRDPNAAEIHCGLAVLYVFAAISLWFGLSATTAPRARFRPSSGSLIYGTGSIRTCPFAFLCVSAAIFGIGAVSEQQQRRRRGALHLAAHQRAALDPS